jgi:L-ascorbate metabolism protein UlaG (beta-lactamase superfamily)
VDVSDIAQVLDVLLITHGHDDHFNPRTAAALSAESECVFVVPVSCTDKAAAIGIDTRRVFKAVPGCEFTVEGAVVSPIRALHGHHHGSVYRHANFQDCGYLLELAGRKILQPGDTVLLHEHLELGEVDVLFVSPTEHNTNIEQSLRLIEAVNPRHIFPQHFGTYRKTPDNAYWTQGFPDRLRAALPAAGAARYHKIGQGSVFTLS